jgi:hypothetical protein
MLRIATPHPDPESGEIRLYLECGHAQELPPEGHGGQMVDCQECEPAPKS